MTFEAFSAALKQNAALAQGSQDVAMAAFAVYDKTDKGVVSAPEWRHVMTSIGDKLNDGSTRSPRSLTSPIPLTYHFLRRS